MEQDPAADLEQDAPPSPASHNGRPRPPLDYDQALAFWYGRINYERQSPRRDDLKLDRMLHLLELLGNPHRDLRIVHIAGSKGKGSTAAMLAAVLGRAGCRTGLFTSPHLCRVEERIQIDQRPIGPGELTALLGEVRDAVRVLDGRPDPAGSVTFFEVATAVGFLHFARRRVDAAVVEVGLGGRFDSTNVCRPLVSLITSISLDHTAQLGNRPAQIAMEKAGIVKPGRPALSGARDPEARPVIEDICRQRGAPLRQLGVEIRYRHEAGRVDADAVSWPRVQVTTDRRSWPAMPLGLLGEHQAANAALAVAAVEELRAEGFAIPDRAVADGLAGVRWPARLEVFGRRPLLVLDCAHNVASAEALVETLLTSFPPLRGAADGPGQPRGKRVLVFAGSSDKDLPGMLAVLAPHFAHVYLTRYQHNPRSVPPDDLAAILRAQAYENCSTHRHAPDALQAARAAAGPDDLVCVTGSVFLAGELRPLLQGQEERTR